MRNLWINFHKHIWWFIFVWREEGATCFGRLPSSYLHHHHDMPNAHQAWSLLFSMLIGLRWLMQRDMLPATFVETKKTLTNTSNRCTSTSLHWKDSRIIRWNDKQNNYLLWSSFTLWRIGISIPNMNTRSATVSQQASGRISTQCHVNYYIHISKTEAWEMAHLRLSKKYDTETDTVNRIGMEIVGMACRLWVQKMYKKWLHYDAQTQLMHGPWISLSL